MERKTLRTHKVFEDTSVEGFEDGYKGKDVGFNEVRIGGDAILICSVHNPET